VLITVMINNRLLCEKLAVFPYARYTIGFQLVNIQGNERADPPAKLSLSLPITNMKLPPCELLSCFEVLSGGVVGYMGLL